MWTKCTSWVSQLQAHSWFVKKILRSSQNCHGASILEEGKEQGISNTTARVISQNQFNEDIHAPPHTKVTIACTTTTNLTLVLPLWPCHTALDPSVAAFAVTHHQGEFSVDSLHCISCSQNSKQVHPNNSSTFPSPY